METHHAVGQRERRYDNTSETTAMRHGKHVSETNHAFRKGDRHGNEVSANHYACRQRVRQDENVHSET